MEDKRFLSARDLEAAAWGFPKRMKPLPRPLAAKWGTAFALAGAVVGVVNVAVGLWLMYAISGPSLPVLPIAVVFVLLYLTLVLTVILGRNWGRWLFAIAVGFSIAWFTARYDALMSGEDPALLTLFITMQFHGVTMHPHWLIAMLNVTVLSAHVSALILFFTRSSRRWFRKNSYHLRMEAKSGRPGSRG